MVWKKWLTAAPFALLLLVGCQNEESETEPKADVRDGVFTIVIGKEDAFDLQDMESSLEKEFGLNVEIEAVSEEKKRRLLFEGKADVALLAPEEIGLAVDEGLVQEVSVPKGMYMDASVEALRYRGKQYGYPAVFASPVFVYNPAVYKEAPVVWDDFSPHVQVKENPVSEKTATQEEDEKETSLTPTIEKPFAFYMDMAKYENVEAFLVSYGYQPFAKEKGELVVSDVRITTKNVQTAFASIARYQEEMIPNVQLNAETLAQQYDDGEIAAFVADRNVLDELTSDYRVDVIPSIEEDVPYRAGLKVKGWVTAVNVENQAVVDAFYDKLTEETFVQTQAENGVYVPVNAPSEEADETVKTYYRQAQNAYALPIAAEKKELRQPTMQALKWYLNGKLPAEESLAKAKKTIEFEIRTNY